MKLHGLPPTLQEKTRYVLCEIIPEGMLPTLDAIESQLQRSIIHYVGVFGLAQSGAYIVRSHSKLPFVVIKCTSTTVDAVRKSTQYFATVGPLKGQIVTHKTSGMLSHVIPSNLPKKEIKSQLTKYGLRECKAQTIN